MAAAMATIHTHKSLMIIIIIIVIINIIIITITTIIPGPFLILAPLEHLWASRKSLQQLSND